MANRAARRRGISNSSDDSLEEATGYSVYPPAGSPVGFPIESPMDSLATSPESSLESSPVGSRATSPIRCPPTTSASSLKRTFENLENGKIHKFFKKLFF